MKRILMILALLFGLNCAQDDFIYFTEDSAQKLAFNAISCYHTAQNAKLLANKAKKIALHIGIDDMRVFGKEIDSFANLAQKECAHIKDIQKHFAQINQSGNSLARIELATIIATSIGVFATMSED